MKTKKQKENIEDSQGVIMMGILFVLASLALLESSSLVHNLFLGGYVVMIFIGLK